MSKPHKTQSHDNQTHYDIIVMGCGPAGCVTALGLARMGYSVGVIGQVRKHTVTEGISERVYQSLKHLKLMHTLATVGQPTPRRVSWNGQSSAANTERLIERIAFDRALLQDLSSQGVSVHQEQILQHSQHGNEWQIQTRNGHSFGARFVVEARGRSAPLKHNNIHNNRHTNTIRGPESLSLGQNWVFKNKNCSAFAQAISVEGGWLWLAAREDGNLFTQLSISSATNKIPNKHKIQSYIQAQLQQIPDIQDLLPAMSATGNSLARGSTPILVNSPVCDNLLRVGDAALAGDPLSGNGIFLALSSALSAPAVINTLLKKPERASLARQFYEDRIQHLFYRFGRIGRDFYRMEQRYSDTLFWRERTDWPDNKSAHNTAPTTLETAKRPVLNNNFIEEQTVVISQEHPLGIWRIGDQLAVDVFQKSLTPETKHISPTPHHR